MTHKTNFWRQSSRFNLSRSSQSTFAQSIRSFSSFFSLLPAHNEKYEISDLRQRKIKSSDSTRKLHGSRGICVIFDKSILHVLSDTITLSVIKQSERVEDVANSCMRPSPPLPAADRRKIWIRHCLLLFLPPLPSSTSSQGKLWNPCWTWWDDYSAEKYVFMNESQKANERRNSYWCKIICTWRIMIFSSCLNCFEEQSKWIFLTQRRTRNSSMNNSAISPSMNTQSSKAKTGETKTEL